jgi:hypothetical protein
VKAQELKVKVKYQFSQLFNQFNQLSQLFNQFNQLSQ